MKTKEISAKSIKQGDTIEWSGYPYEVIQASTVDKTLTLFLVDGIWGTEDNPLRVTPETGAKITKVVEK